LTCGPELAPFFSVVAAVLVVMGSGMRDNADFIPFCARRNSISALFCKRFLPLQKYSISGSLIHSRALSQQPRR
jgi:hypothetical protein